MRERSSAGLHVRESDDDAANTLVLLHAFPVDGRLYTAQIEAPPRRWRILAPDLPGFGNSKPRDVATLDDYASAVIDLLDAEGIERCPIGGTSMGGYIVFALLRMAPRRFSGVLLADTKLGADNEEGKRTREENAQRAERDGVGPVVEGLLPKLLAPASMAAHADTVRAMAQAADPAGVAAALRAMAVRPDASDVAAQIQVPSLIVCGSEDAISPPAEAEAMFRAIDASHLEIISGAGHLPALEAPGRFNAALDTFLATV